MGGRATPYEPLPFQWQAVVLRDTPANHTMHHPTFTLFACLLLASASLTAQSLAELSTDPATLTEAFARGGIRPAAQAYTGEAAERPVSLEKLPQAPNIAVEQLWRDSARALVAIEYANSISAQDLYTFLDSTEAGWRISAFRSFDLPSVYYQQLDRYRNQGEASIRRNYNEKLKASMERGVTQAAHEGVHGTVEDRLFYVFNLRLVSSSDADLARHFEFLRARFDETRVSLSAKPTKLLAYEHDDADLGDELRYLLIKRAYHPERGPLRFELASIDGHDVGYLYCTDPTCMPTPTPGGVIALRALGDGWWIYRTI